MTKNKGNDEEKKNAKHPGGRPTKYKPEMADSMIEFFEKEPYREEYNPKLGYRDIPNDIPFFSQWCKEAGITKETMNQWKNDPDKPEFSDAYKKCKDLQKNFLIINGLRGLYNSTFAIFTAKNITDMKDKQEIDHTTGGEKFKSIPIHSFVSTNDEDE